ncbi:hypothetical protein ACYULU_03105 [Breznakiellaceae bacterium SP9]
MHSIEVGASLAWALAATARYSDIVVGGRLSTQPSCRSVLNHG